MLLSETGKPAEALAAYEQARAIRERLARENPTVTQFQSDLATSHDNIGMLLRETGKPAEALAAYEQARAIQERLARENPTVTQFQSDLAVSHNNIGMLLSDTGKPAEALAAYEQARAIQERLARENPTVTQFQSDLAASPQQHRHVLRRKPASRPKHWRPTSRRGRSRSGWRGSILNRQTTPADWAERLTIWR